MGSASPQGYLSGIGNPEAPKKVQDLYLCTLLPWEWGKGRREVNKAVAWDHGGGCLDLLFGASQSRWELTHKVTAAGCN